MPARLTLALDSDPGYLDPGYLGFLSLGKFFMRLAVPLLCLCAVTACDSSGESGRADAETNGVAQPEHWRVEIQLPDVALPVGLRMSADFTEAWFENGAEKVIVPDIQQDGNHLRLRFPSFNTTLDLQLDGDRFNGSLSLSKLGYEQVMPVQGWRGETHRFSAQAEAAVDVTGRWEVGFTDDEGNQSMAVAEFDQQGSQLSGTFLTPTGDYRYLAGEVDGRQLKLSTFDGAHAFVFTAGMQQDGELSGDFWSGTRWHERWQARRNFDASLPDPYSLTFLKEGYDGLAFRFPDLDGQPVSLADEKYQGKVVLVTLSGTWCPNCADEVAFLSGYFRDNRHRGLEIITLLYEHYEEFELAAAQGKALRDEYSIEYDLLVAGLSDKTLAAETLPMLNRVLAFPTMIFVDRAGEVRRIHTGFTGPGTGRHYTEFVAGFEQTMDELLAEPASGMDR